MTARRDSWLVRYELSVCFDTDPGRSRYDHVGAEARCGHCGARLATWSPTALVGHARSHEGELSLDDDGTPSQCSTTGGLTT